MGKTLSKSKSKCTVCIWLPDGSRVGHASLEVADGTYISWWPKDKKGLRFGVPGTDNARKDDIMEEGEPDYTLCFPPDNQLDQVAMKEWWQEFKNEGTWDIKKNCCWVVKTTLIAGGIERYVNIDNVIIDNPINLKKVLRKY